LEQGAGIDCVYLDFAKAFDKVETGVLLHKLKHGKVKGKLGCWLAAFLDSNNRQQAVAVEGRISSLSPVISGVPQGTVLGPVLFLLHISDIARGVSAKTTTSSYVDDTRVNRCISDSDIDCQALQEDLTSIYSWATDVNMTFNADKFECLRFWPGKTAKPEGQYMSPDNTPIEEKSHLTDLGVEISSDLTFQTHIENTLTAANRLVGWSLRTFRRRSSMVMMTIWKSLIQCKLDYCSQLWSPVDQASISRLESVCRHFTAQIAGLGDLDYWERLTALRMYSQERRRERYRIIFIWKVLQGYVQGYNIPSKESPRRGRLVEVAQYHRDAPAAVKQAREASISVHGAKLFNLLPRHIRDISCGTTDQFKAELDSWLGLIPDQPTIPGRQRASKTNSLIDQAAYAAQ
jgi:ribonuclease P/MRP protein subunit RPP40